MARKTNRAADLASDVNTAQLRDEMPSRRTPTKTSARDPATAPFDTDDEAAGRPAPPAAVARVLAEENSRRARESAHARRSPLGSLGWTPLVIGLMALAGLVVTWLLLVA